MTAPAKTIAGAIEIGKDPRRGDRFVLSNHDIALLAAAVDVLAASTPAEQRSLDRLRLIFGTAAHAAA